MNYRLEDYLNGHKDNPIPLPMTRWRHLGHLISERGYKVGAEIGVQKGQFSKNLLDRVYGLEMYCVDNWVWKRRGEAISDYEQAVKRLAPYRATILRMTSMEALSVVPDGLDFVYIDADHTFDFVVQDIIEWSKKVRPGGMVSGHDYFENPNIGVFEAVNAYTKTHQISPWFITAEQPPTWLWIKQ